tara:strand:+ start:2809 stop:3414 length:606 start_codon:yes stop_codon:yes gene_type:complete
MPIKLGFSNQINSSLSVNDLIYYTSTTANGGYNTAGLDDLILVGPVLNINRRPTLRSSLTKSFVADLAQTTFPLNESPWESSFNTPLDEQEFIVFVNGVEVDPLVGIYPYSQINEDLVFTNPLTGGEEIIVQLLYTIEIDDSSFIPVAPILDSTSFIMFKKNEIVETQGLKGYYAEARFENNSTEKSKIFAASAEINESSK